MKPILFLVLFTSAASAAYAQGFHSLERAERTPLRYEITEEPFMPPSLLQDGVNSGYARIAVRITADGKLADALITGHSDQRLSRSAMNAIKKWRFTPGTLDGEPVGIVTEFLFNFEGSGVIVNISASEALSHLMPFTNRQNEYAISTLKEIDRIPLPIATVTPTYPKEWSDKGVKGAVEVEFFIDETGAVRMPHVVSADFIELADMAIHAVSQWKFEPPSQKGRPVAIRARQQFKFGM